MSEASARGACYVLCVPRGMEEAVVRHAAGMPGVSEADLLTDGAVELQYSGPLERLHALRVAEGVFRRLGVFLSSRNPDEMMRNLVSQVDFRAWNEGKKGDGRFFVTVEADPALDLRPREFQAEVTWALRAILRTKPAPDGRQIHIVAGAEAGWAGVSCGARPRRSPGQGDPAALPAAVAAGMALCAGIQPDDRVLDPLCGSGEILLERAMAGPAAAILGGDVNEAAVRAAHRRIAEPFPAACLCRWDPRRLPLNDRSIDAIISHLPSGQQVGSRQVARSLYQSLLREACRLLRATGRAVLLTTEPETLSELLTRQPEFSVETQRTVRSGRFRAEMFFIKPTLKLL